MQRSEKLSPSLSAYTVFSLAAVSRNHKQLCCLYWSQPSPICLNSLSYALYSSGCVSLMEIGCRKKTLLMEIKYCRPEVKRCIEGTSNEKKRMGMWFTSLCVQRVVFVLFISLIPPRAKSTVFFSFSSSFTSSHFVVVVVVSIIRNWPCIRLTRSIWRLRKIQLYADAVTAVGAISVEWNSFDSPYKCFLISSRESTSFRLQRWQKSIWFTWISIVVPYVPGSSCFSCAH